MRADSAESSHASTAPSLFSSSHQYKLRIASLTHPFAMPFPVAPRLPSSRAISTTVARAAGSSRLAPSTMSFISHTGSSRNPCRPTPRGRAQFLAPLAFPTTTSRSFASASKSIRDAEHPTGLWYHPLSSSSDVTRYAVSYLSQPPASSDSKDVIAVFEVPSPEASDPAVFARQHPDRVVANKAFWSTLHATLKDDVVAGEKDPILTQEADLREDGWAHLAGE